MADLHAWATDVPRTHTSILTTSDAGLFGNAKEAKLAKRQLSQRSPLLGVYAAEAHDAVQRCPGSSSCIRCCPSKRS